MQWYSLACLLVIMIQPVVVDSFFQWILGSGQPSQNGQDPTPAEVSFELTPTDEKFLSEVKKLDTTGVVGDSALGDCHTRLVLSLKQSCGKLSPEEIGKVAVNLLNCQNTIERRRRYPCTASMSLADCTRDMDSTSWTVYQLMSNRALAVCHSVGQQLFRARTEVLVNRLASASEQQVGQLREMHGWHERLRELQVMAHERMGSLTAQHDAMVAGQEALLKRQGQLEQALELNERHLRQEQGKIEDGTRGLLSLTGEVKARLDATVNEIRRQEDALLKQRTHVDSTLKQYEDSLRGLLSALEAKGEGVLALQEETFTRVRASLEGIQRVDDSIGNIGTRLLSLQEKASGYIGWWQTIFVERRDMSWFCAIHATLLFVMMGLTAFLNFPIASRLAIITVIPANVYLKLNSAWHALPMELLVSLGVLCTTDLLITRLRSRKPKSASALNDEIRRLVSSVKCMEQQIEDLTVNSPPRNSTFNGPSPEAYHPSLVRDTELSRLATSQEWDSTSLQGSGPKQRCQGFTRDGLRCKRTTSSVHCYVHRKTMTNDVVGQQQSLHQQPAR